MKRQIAQIKIKRQLLVYIHFWSGSAHENVVEVLNIEYVN